MVTNNSQISEINLKDLFLTHTIHSAQTIREGLFVIVIQGFGMMEDQRFYIGNDILRPDMTKITSIHNQWAWTSHMWTLNLKGWKNTIPYVPRRGKWDIT